MDVLNQSCVTCKQPVDPERWDLGYHYCLEDACVKANYKPAVYLEIGQTKTNATYVRADEQTLREIADGKYKRDPVVVKRQATSAPPAKVKGTFAPPKREQYNAARVRYVQSLADQKLSPDQIMERASFMQPRLTRQEIYRYMSARRI